MAAAGRLPVEQAPPSTTATGRVHDADADLDARVAAGLERVGHVIRTLVWQRAYARGLSPMQAQLLLHICGQVHPPRVGDLAAEFDVTAATVSDALAALRRKGFVTREQGTADRRSFVFAITAAGADLTGELSRWAEPIVGHLSTVDRNAKAAALALVLDLLAALHTDGIPAVARTCVTCRFFDRGAHHDAERPHHCTLLDTAFGDAGLRVDCAEHQPAAADRPRDGGR